jgi:hypothetical protein
MTKPPARNHKTLLRAHVNRVRDKATGEDLGVLIDLAPAGDGWTFAITPPWTVWRLNVDIEKQRHPWSVRDLRDREQAARAAHG